ncbi:MAG TPA: hypothetical protein VEQ66_03235 [Propionibacteriaceae bacterium]|nr:hypothetical protein [Propionibacteriaceae bacterium]
MTSTDTALLIGQLTSGQATATADVLAQARTSREPTLLVAAALFDRAASTVAHDLMTRAASCAQSTRERQLVTIATAHLAGQSDRVDALAREHLTDFPDSVLVSWIAANARSDHSPPPPLSPRQPAITRESS